MGLVVADLVRSKDQSGSSTSSDFTVRVAPVLQGEGLHKKKRTSLIEYSRALIGKRRVSLAFSGPGSAFNKVQKLYILPNVQDIALGLMMMTHLLDHGASSSTT